MTHHWSAFALATSFIATSALAQQAEVPKPAAKEKKVCRRMEETGSIMPRNTCMTKEQWAQYDAQNAQNTEAMRRQREGRTGL